MGSLVRERLVDEDEDDDEVGVQPEAPVSLEPQPGPQEMFSECTADIVIFGGSAGGGKSYALLLEPLRNTNNSQFAAVIFRRTTPSIRNPGALWDESNQIYNALNPNEKPQPNKSSLEWIFPVLPPAPPGIPKSERDRKDGMDMAATPGAGAKVKFAHLEYDDTVHDWHGAQVPLICFDELCEFTQYQFFYMLSRNRSTCGVKPYIRATCNPDANSWVADFIGWWIDQDPQSKTYGLPIPERAGVKRYFVRIGDSIKWASKRSDLTPAKLGISNVDRQGRVIKLKPKSVTFIPSTLFDNKALMAADPGYLANLLALPTVERERLLGGNWKVKPSAGMYFKREWIKPENIIDLKDLPKNLVCKRGWDLAATEKTQLNNPDFTAGTKIGKASDKKVDPYTYIIDHKFAQKDPGGVEQLILSTAALDGINVEQWLPQDPGQAGKSQILNYVKLLNGYPVRGTPERGNKLVRFSPFSAMAKAGLVKLVRGDWNERWLSILEAFTGEDGAVDDDVDSTSRAYNSFMSATDGIIDYYRDLASKIIQDKINENAVVKATAENGGVYMKGPPGVNLLMGMKGEPIFQEEDGSFIVDPKHAMLLRRSGQWTDVKPKESA